MSASADGPAGSLFDGPRFAELRRTLAGADWRSARYLDRGWQADAYRVGEWVVRVPRSPVAGEQLWRQTRLYQALAPAGIAVPRDAKVARDEAGAVAAGLYRHIPGNHATADRRTDRLAHDLGRFLTALHRFPTDGVRDCCEVVADLWAGRFEPRWRQCRDILSGGEREWVEGVATRFLEAGGGVGGPVAAVHGDLAQEHLIVTGDGGLAGVIDFSGPRIADPALDFGTAEERFGGAFAEAALAAYAGPVDRGFRRRARFYADVRPLSTIALGLARGSDERVLDGRRRLAARMAAP